jgi:hypothetical protein
MRVTEVIMCEVCYAEFLANTREVPSGFVTIIIDNEACTCGHAPKKKCEGCTECNCGEDKVPF